MSYNITPKSDNLEIIKHKYYNSSSFKTSIKLFIKSKQSSNAFLQNTLLVIQMLSSLFCSLKLIPSYFATIVLNVVASFDLLEILPFWWVILFLMNLKSFISDHFSIFPIFLLDSFVKYVLAFSISLLPFKSFKSKDDFFIILYWKQISFKIFSSAEIINPKKVFLKLLVKIVSK